MANGTAAILHNHQETFVNSNPEGEDDDLFANLNYSLDKDSHQKDNTEYLHVILSGDVDEVSHANLTDVFRLNKKMKLFLNYYKCAYIPYMSKGNDALKK